MVEWFSADLANPERWIDTEQWNVCLSPVSGLEWFELPIYSFEERHELNSDSCPLQ